jgi:hypothetical protein
MKKCNKYLVIFSFLLGACHVTPPIELVSNGKSDYAIVVPSDPNKQEQRAAALFQDYIQQVSGCSLAVVHHLDEGSKGVFIREEGRINYDGYRIKSDKSGSIYIDGSKNKGCVYGVITILEKYVGCHLYTPNYKIIPKNKDIRLPYMDLADSSVNENRMINIPDEAFSQDQDLLDWHRISVEYNFAHHTFNSFVPWKNYFNQHPEYYALINGKRTPEQLCLSNTNVLDLVIRTLKERMEANPQTVYWPVAQNDSQVYCECDDCKKTIDEEKSPSGPVIRFVNEVARQFPDKIIPTFAYQYSQPAPAVVKPEENVQITLCSYTVNRSKPIAADTCAESRKFRKDLVDWGKISNRICVWDYCCNFNYYPAPYPNLHVLQPNIQLFVKNNVADHFQQTDIRTGDAFAELKFYLTSRLLWNPETDVSSAMDEFLVAYYGDAAVWIRKYIDQLQSELMRSGDNLGIYDPPFWHQDSYLSEENIRAYYTYLDKAGEAVKKDQTLSRHVQLVRSQIDFAVLEIAKMNMFGPRGWYDPAGAVRNAGMDSMLEAFCATFKEEKVGRLNELGLSTEHYCEQTKYVSNVRVSGNHAFRKNVKATPAPSEMLSKGDLTLLTDGVRGDDMDLWAFRWLGWEGTDIELQLDLEQSAGASAVEMTTLCMPDQWRRILHPLSVECLVSKSEDAGFRSAGTITLNHSQVFRSGLYPFTFDVSQSGDFRYVKLKVRGTIVVPKPHTTAGRKSNVCIDEIIVRDEKNI